MIIQPAPPLLQPSTDLRLWRYMSFSKLLSWLIEDGIYFTRADQFEDPYEGRFSTVNREELEALEKRAADAHQARAMAEVNGEHFVPFYDPHYEYHHMRGSLEVLKGVPGHVYVSCWHSNEDESAAMWKLYGMESETIAIETTYSNLRAICTDEIMLGMVSYIDYRTTSIPELGVFAPIMHKRTSFAHEREARLIWWDQLQPQSPPTGEIGRLVKADLRRLIRRVHVCPTAAPWFLKVVHETLTRYQLFCDVSKSELYSYQLE